MKFRTASLMVGTAAVAVVLAVQVFSDPVPGSGGTINQRLCQVHQACNQQPQCPAANCNHCNHLENDHERCAFTLWTKCEWWVDDRECGVKVNGTCDATGTCITEPTIILCPREACRTSGT